MAIHLLYCRSVQVARTLIVLVGLAVFSLACDKDRPDLPDNPPLPAPRASVARALGVDAGELEPAVDPPAAAGDLKADIDGFTTVDACVETHAHLDPLLGDALEAIGYDTFVRDACRVLDAAKSRDAKRCEPIDASALRRQCEGTLAALAGDADTCPWMIPGRPALGRDPWCLAVASRDPRLCGAQETTADRATCAAIVAHDPAACGKLPLRADQARCRRDSDRWRNVIPGPDAGLSALPAAEGVLHVEGGDGGAPIDVSLAPDLARGIVLVDERGAQRFTLGVLSENGPGFIAASPHLQASLAVEIAASTDGKRVDIARAELLVPGHSPVATPLATSSLHATVTTLDHTRGGAVSLTLDGVLADSTGSYRVHAEEKSFVRDVVSAKAIYGAGLLRFGDAGAMR
jgi:hypothetical protein